ncbi:hypothetical protein [Streptomyces sp. NPDC096311]|uniref:hypothetical protein n=1 Tax=Streptomyces sp. NPDC096311 TaxID=3366083 RepID=UPI0037FCF8C8
MPRQQAGIDRIPAPRNDDERLLLKLVWQEAAKEGWPTFRMIDLSLYQQGIDAVEVLAQIPPHLLVGWPDTRHHVPSPNTLLKLTAAGVAHCAETTDVIDTFVTLVRTLAHVEEHWPARSEQPVRLHSKNAQAETGLLSRPELKELLRLGFILSREEPWCVYSESLTDPFPLRTFAIRDDGPEDITPTVHWKNNVGLFGWELWVDRRIRAYRGLEDIGDYWSRRCRQLAAADRLVPAPAPPPVRDLFTPWHLDQPSLAAHAALLVLWLSEKVDEDILRYENPEQFTQEQQLTDARLQAVLAYAQQQGTIEVLQTLRHSTVRLTITGMATVEQFLRARHTRRVRFDYLTSALVKAAMDTYPQCRLVMEEFLASDALCLYRDRLTREEALQAAEYLGEKGLAVLDRRDGRLQALRLESAGIECGLAVEDDLSVREFMANQPGFSIGTVNGSIVQFGNLNTQHNTQHVNHGASPAELADFAQRVLGAAHTTDLSEEQRSQLIDDAEQLANESASSAPNPGRMRQLGIRIRDVLAQGATDAITQGLLDAAHHLF